LQFTWHYFDLFEKGVTSRRTRSMDWTGSLARVVSVLKSDYCDLDALFSLSHGNSVSRCCATALLITAVAAFC